METSAGQGEHGTGKSVKGSIRKIPSESVIRLWRNFLRQCLIRGLEVDFCSLPFRKKLYRRSIKNPNPFPIWKIWFGLYAFGAPGRSRTCGLQSRSLTLYPTELRVHVQKILYRRCEKMSTVVGKLRRERIWVLIWRKMTV